MTKKLLLGINIIILCALHFNTIAQEKATINSHLRTDNFIILLDSTLITTKELIIKNEGKYDMDQVKVTIDDGTTYKGKKLIGYKKNGKYYGNMQGFGNYALLYDGLGAIKTFYGHVYYDGRRSPTLNYYQMQNGPICWLDRSSLIKTFKDNPVFLEKAKALPKLFENDKLMLALVDEYNKSVAK